MAHDLLLILHILLVVSWLGIDVGVFYSSFVMRRPGLSTDARNQVRNVMVALDLAPRISLVLMIPVGLALSHVTGLAFGEVDRRLVTSLLWATTLLALAWVAATVWAFRRRRLEPGAAGLRRFDRADVGARAVVALAFLGLGLASLVGAGPFRPLWLAAKAAIFGLIVAAGLWIRAAARRYRPALQELLAEGETPARLDAVNRSIRGVYPAVLSVWFGLVVMVALAVIRP